MAKTNTVSRKRDRMNKVNLEGCDVMHLKLSRGAQIKKNPPDDYYRFSCEAEAL